MLGLGAGHRAIEQPHALVFQVQVELAGLADLEDAKVDFAGFDTEAGSGNHVAGKFAQQLIEATVVVGKLVGFLGGPDEVEPAQAAEEAFEVALAEQVARGRPVFLAGHGQLVEVPALPAGGKDEWLLESLGANGERPTVAHAVAEHEAVKIAVAGVFGVGASAFCANLDHGTFSVQFSVFSVSIFRLFTEH